MFRWRNSRPGTRRLRARSIPVSATEETEKTDINDDISLKDINDGISTEDITEEGAQANDITEERTLPAHAKPTVSQCKELESTVITDSNWITDSSSITDSIDITDNFQITDTSLITDTT